MIPILYDSNETAFTSNGIGRLRDCISCTVTEERNGIYECDFEYPIDGARYEDILCGRIIAVTHDDTGDVQPFDIVSYSKPINGIVTFHAVHISYRQSEYTVYGTNINTLADAFTLIKNNATPTNPFIYSTDKASTGYMSSADGIPRTVRQMLGGVEGSILDAYGGEYKWDKFNVELLANRGQVRDFTIRYGVNLTDYTDETDYQGTFTSVIPFWQNEDEYGATQTVIGNKVLTGIAGYNGREICVPLDLTDKFETEPTTAQLQNFATSYLQQAQPYLPSQNITVDFIRLQDMPEFADFRTLLQCELCDTIKVEFPLYGMSGQFKIVKTVWNVLEGKFDSMELGNLSTSLAEALGISESTTGGESSGYAFVKLSGDTMTGDLVNSGTYYKNTSIELVGADQAYDSVTSASFASGDSWKDLMSVPLTPGIYVLVGSAGFGTSSTGMRGIGWSNASDSVFESSIVMVPAMASYNTRIQSVVIVKISSTTTYKLKVKHTSGASMNIYGYYRYLKLS